MRRTLAALAFSASLAACGEASLDPEGAGASDPAAPCTDPDKCCPKEKIVCSGDPDGKIVCQCNALWDCSKNPKKCEQPMPVPSGSGSWSCAWSAKQYVCTSKGSKSTPPGGEGWSCTWLASQSSWRCTSATPPNPSNTPGGGASWTCVVDEIHKKLVCERTGTSPPPSSPPPSPPASKADAGVPPPSTPPPSKPKADAGAPPPWPPWPWPPKADAGAPKPKPDTGTVTPPAPKPGQECVPGTKRWCDGEIYCGWGQQVCLPTGKWDGKCVELSDGRRPNTLCACLHEYFEEKCCETPDCIVPAGTNGTDCKSYAGGKLCDPCNPQKPNCTEPGAKCVVLAGQSFCGRGCSATQPCPAGYVCKSSQCIPTKLSCY